MLIRCSTLNGGWTLSWQGEKADVYAGEYNTILEAVIQRAGHARISYEPGVTYKTADPPTIDILYWEENKPEIEKAVAAAGKLIISCCVLVKTRMLKLPEIFRI